MLSSAVAVADAPQAPAPLKFEIIRNGSIIGHHDMTFTAEGDNVILEIDIAIKVDLLFVTVFRYEHHNREVWQGDHLLSIASNTLSDGKKGFLRGRDTPTGFEIETQKGKATLPAGIMSTTYWRPTFLKQTQVMHSETGELLKISIADKGLETVEARGQKVQARHYEVRGDLNLDLWYDDTGTWVHGTTKGKDGSDIVYRLK